MSIQWKELLLTVMAGSFVTSIGVFLTGFTAAFAMPKWFSPYIIIWDLVIVQFLGVGVISAFVAFFLAKIMRFHPNLVAIILFASVVFFSALYQGFYHFYWPYILVLGICLVIGSRVPFNDA